MAKDPEIASQKADQPAATTAKASAEKKAKSRPELFKTLDPQGYTISLDSQRWEHIVNGHPEMKPLLNKVQETVMHPEIIQRDAKNAETHYYYRLSGRKFSRAKDIYVNAVVARYESSKTGFVKTAFLVQTIRKHGEEFVWLNRK